MKWITSATLLLICPKKGKVQKEGKIGLTNRRGFLQRLLAAPYLVWAAIFIVVPLGMVLYYAFTDQNGAFTFQNFEAITGFTDTFTLSIWLGALATLICLVISYPLAYIISRMHPRHQKFMMMLVMLPMWINLLLRTYALMKIIEDTGLINSVLSWVGLPKLHMINTRGAVVAGMVYNFIPYMIMPIYNVMTRIEDPVLEASRDLGGNFWQTLRRVIFPLSVPGIVSGITMVFVPSVSTFYISGKLGGNIALVGDLIEYTFNSEANYNVGATMSLILMVMILLCMVIMNQFAGDEEEAILV
jgi:spermidine/putrescine transport system permease protein